MAFMGILFIYFFVFIPIMIALALFAGLIISVAISAIISTILLIVLTKKGFFEKYKQEESKFKRYASILFHYALIAFMIMSYLSTIALGIIMYLASH